MDSTDDPFPLHRAVFENNIRRLTTCLKGKGVEIEKRDAHSLTALLLAAKLGRIDCAKVLVENGASVDAKSDDGWSVMDEAVAYGNREVIEFLSVALFNQADSELANLKPKLVEALDKIPDFTLVFHWELSTWIPLLSHALPSDTCTLYKHGTKLRMDATLQSLDPRHRRGSLSYFFDCMEISHLTVVDHEQKCKQVLKPEITNKFVMENTSWRLSKDVTHSFISTQPISLVRCRSGWLWRSDKVEEIAGYECPVFDVNGVALIQRRRNEHLNDEDIQRLKSMRAALNSEADETDGSRLVDDQSSDNDNGDSPDSHEDGRFPFRPSLPPPELTATWQEYVDSSSGGMPEGVGRAPRFAEDQRTFKPTVALSQDFPIPRDLILDILEVIAPYRHFNKLRSLISSLPPGFPLKIDMPIFPTVSIRLAFKEFRTETHNSSFFTVPHYTPGRVFRQNGRV